jgi:hypothetical protein
VPHRGSGVVKGDEDLIFINKKRLRPLSNGRNGDELRRRLFMSKLTPFSVSLVDDLVYSTELGNVDRRIVDEMN